MLNLAGKTGGVTVFGASSLLSVFGGGEGDRSGGAIDVRGGGGGGWFSAGITGGASPATKGEAGSYGANNTSIFSSRGGISSVAALDAMYSAGGGQEAKGGDAILGGAGGGGATTASVEADGGTSKLGGNGGKGCIFGGVGTDGSILGGGGGASGDPAFTGGAGGDGTAIVITFV